jgi:hypothetical protein
LKAARPQINPQRPKEAAQALRLALHHGVNPKDIGLWSLFPPSGNAELLRVFLEAGANPNASDEAGGGCTLLHYLAASPDARPSIEVLLQFKANINARDSVFGLTPLTWAVVQRRLDMVQFLLARGAAIELPDDQPWTTPRPSFAPGSTVHRAGSRAILDRPIRFDSDPKACA